MGAHMLRFAVTAALVACMADSGAWCQSVDVLPPNGFPVHALLWPPDVVPARALLDAEVSIDATGTVVDIVARIAEGAERDWMLSVAPGAELREARLTANAEPVWTVLDRLHDAFGYDWGVVESTIVCWPAMLPAQERGEPAPEPMPEQAAGDVGKPMRFATPVDVSQALAGAREAGALAGSVVFPHPELAPWRVAGYLSAPDNRRFLGAFAGALGATGDYAGVFLRLTLGSYRRLDAAMRLIDARPELSGLSGEELRLGFRNAVVPLFCAQQWAILRSRGFVAEIAFRELPDEVAAMVVAKVREESGKRPLSFEPDWGRAPEIKVTGWHNSGWRRTEAAWVPVPSLAVVVNVPSTNGVLRGL